MDTKASIPSLVGAQGTSISGDSIAAPDSISISVLEIQLGDSGNFPLPPCLSLASSSPSRDTATRTPLLMAGENAAADATASVEGENAAPDATGSTPKSTAPPAKSTNHKDALKVLFVIVGATFSIMEFIKDINSTWKTGWKVLYSSLVMLSLVSTVAGLFAALSPAGSWGRPLFAFCARFGLLVATALFIIVLTCQLGTFGCVAGVPIAALVVLFLAVVWFKSRAKPE